MVSSKYNDQQIIESVLKEFWNYSSFRDQQREIIDSIISSKDTLALLPTGGGKSLCYQLPAILSEGITIVISPLLALMKEQVQDLLNRGIPASYISSEFEDDQLDTIYENLRNNIYKILYISPERLLNKIFLENISNIEISFIAVDEAHCISEWGNDFRPSYQSIRNFRELYPNIPCLALTATASTKVIQEIKEKLNFKNSNTFKKSYKRTNLYIRQIEISDKFQYIHQYLKNIDNSGLIYARTRKETENLSLWLKNMGLEKVDFYHAGLSVKEKQIKQNRWLHGNNFVLISTNAFGMGIDKDNVDFVIHLSPPPSIENYYQEIGRAGRGGQDADTVLLWNENELFQMDDQLNNQIAGKTDYQKICSYIYSFCKIAEHEQPKGFFQLHINKIQTLTKISKQKIISVLRFLHNQEIIFLKEQKSFSSLELKFDIEYLEQLRENDSFFIEKLSRNLEGISSRTVYFNEQKLAEKINVEQKNLNLYLQDLHKRELVNYFDGSQAGIKFLQPRNDKILHNKLWNIFAHIQKNKLRKWEEMKFFIKDSSFCKTKLILAYFGEKTGKNCNKCNYCLKKNININDYKKAIFETLLHKPMTLDEIYIYLKFYSKDILLENLKNLLDKKQIKMLNYKTYTI